MEQQEINELQKDIDVLQKLASILSSKETNALCFCNELSVSSRYKLLETIYARINNIKSILKKEDNKIIKEHIAELNSETEKLSKSFGIHSKKSLWDFIRCLFEKK